MEWVLVASGPSAGTAPLHLTKDRNVLAVNDAYKLVPWARAMYAADYPWWMKHEKETRDFKGERWTCTREAAEKWGLKLIIGHQRNGFCFKPWHVYYCLNSGAQAVQLAYHMGARRILLVGVDMRGSHFFGEHPPGLRNTTDKEFAQYIAGFNALARDARGKVEIINCSLKSRLECFPKMSLEDALAGLCPDTGAAALSA